VFTEPLNFLLPLFGIIAFVLVAITSRWLALVGTANFVCRAFIWLLLVKATVPLMLGVSVWVDRSYFTPQIEGALETLAFINDIEEVSVEPPSTIEKGLFDWMGVASQYAKERIASAAKTTRLLRDNFDGMIDALTDLFTAFIGKLVIQVFLLPLAVIWGWKSIASHWLSNDSLLSGSLGSAMREKIS
jgi:hypothetical protein